MRRAARLACWAASPLVWTVYVVALVIPSIPLLMVGAGAAVAEGPAKWPSHVRDYIQQWVDLVGRRRKDRPT